MVFVALEKEARKPFWSVITPCPKFAQHADEVA